MRVLPAACTCFAKIESRVKLAAASPGKCGSFLPRARFNFPSGLRATFDHCLFPPSFVRRAAWVGKNPSEAAGESGEEACGFTGFVTRICTVGNQVVVFYARISPRLSSSLWPRFTSFFQTRVMTRAVSARYAAPLAHGGLAFLNMITNATSLHYPRVGRKNPLVQRIYTVKNR